jgi:hypothetical protein
MPERKTLERLLPIRKPATVEVTGFGVYCFNARQISFSHYNASIGAVGGAWNEANYPSSDTSRSRERG